MQSIIKKPSRLSISLFIIGTLVQAACGLDFKQLVDSVERDRAVRYAAFHDFQIKGVCGTVRLDLAAQYGANTIRTYTPPSRKKLDEYQRLGLKVIVGIWMPHHGENKGNDGVKWNYDYTKKSDDQVADFKKVLERIGDHPAILLWCFGNEVHLDPHYLKTVNRLSQTLHKHDPKQLSSLTMINAPADKIALIKEHAPDLDVIGYNSYGQGAVGSAAERLESEWGRAYYVSEFGPQGPWWGRKTAWGVFYEQSYAEKLSDLRQSFRKIDAAPRCLGSTMFLWGYWNQQKPTYFSAFLSPEGSRKIDEQALYLTPMVDEFAKYWSGKYPAERAPILEAIEIQAARSGDDVIFSAGQRFEVRAKASDPDTPSSQLSYRWWILDAQGKAVADATDTNEPRAEFIAPPPDEDGYYLMGYVIASDQRASGFTVPFMIEAGKAKDAQ
jgi:hypothetical protein